MVKECGLFSHYVNSLVLRIASLRDSAVVFRGERPLTIYSGSLDEGDKIHSDTAGLIPSQIVPFIDVLLVLERYSTSPTSG